MLYGFLLAADPGSADLATLSERYLERPLDADPAAQADTILSLYQTLRPQVESQKLAEVYETIDLPLIRVLARMEEIGIRVDPVQLGHMSGRMEEEIARLSAEIYEIAGKTFNINSPQQLGKVLFEDLNLPAPIKMGKGKVISTAADVLEDLAEEHAIASKVLEHRQLSKLKGTYADALPASDRSGDRPRAHHLQPDRRGHRAAVVVESQSAEHPDPHRTGPRNPRGFRSRAGLEADRRRLFADRAAAAGAHVARSGADGSVPQRRGHSHAHRRRSLGHPAADDHAASSAATRKPSISGSSTGRRRSDCRSQLGIDRKEAELYIRAYFERYAGVRRFIDNTIAEVRRTGMAVSLFGRRRPIPDMNSRNPARAQLRRAYGGEYAAARHRGRSD